MYVFIISATLWSAKSAKYPPLLEFSLNPLDLNVTHLDKQLWA